MIYDIIHEFHFRLILNRHTHNHLSFALSNLDLAEHVHAQQIELAVWLNQGGDIPEYELAKSELSFGGLASHDNLGSSNDLRHS